MFSAQLTIVEAVAFQLLFPTLKLESLSSYYKCCVLGCGMKPSSKFRLNRTKRNNVLYHVIVLQFITKYKQNKKKRRRKKKRRFFVLF